MQLWVEIRSPVLLYKSYFVWLITVDTATLIRFIISLDTQAISESLFHLKKIRLFVMYIVYRRVLVHFCSVDVQTNFSLHNVYLIM